MPDISKCSDGKECPIKDTCYRWTSEPSEYSQTYSKFYIEGQDNEECKCIRFVGGTKYNTNGCIIHKEGE